MEKKRRSKILIFAAVCGVLFLGSTSCVEDEYDLSELSTDSLMVTTAIEAPLAKCIISVDDVFQHRGSKGTVIKYDDLFGKLDSIYDLSKFTKDDASILPGYFVMEDGVVATDTLNGVNIKNVCGKGNTIDSIYTAELTFDVVNEVPLGGSIEFRFLREETLNVMGVETSLYVEEKSLRRSVEVSHSTVGTDRKLLSAGKNTYKVSYDGDDLEALSRVEDIEMVYNLKPAYEEDEYYLSKDYRVSVFLSVYMKAKVLLNN